MKEYELMEINQSIAKLNERRLSRGRTVLKQLLESETVFDLEEMINTADSKIKILKSKENKAKKSKKSAYDSGRLPGYTELMLHVKINTYGDIIKAIKKLISFKEKNPSFGEYLSSNLPKYRISGYQNTDLSDSVKSSLENLYANKKIVRAAFYIDEYRKKKLI